MAPKRLNNGENKEPSESANVIEPQPSTSGFTGITPGDKLLDIFMDAYNVLRHITILQQLKAFLEHPVPSKQQSKATIRQLIPRHVEHFQILHVDNCSQKVIIIAKLTPTDI
ncbi:hypothetical protein E2C01_031732 [Portunus trituberculatus]|uniref:Uncharacterized protein n=1 Tax=Portunus trituberculatus TaxID=210409 RepID=A0A5B7EYY3_PORTR|nr:hypothetical protein [Portunus trituberculatus]